jgi:hypothetical protein
VFSQSAQNLLNMSHVLLPHSDEDEDVIQIYHHKGVGEESQYISINLMKVVGAFVMPKGMTSHSKRHYLYLKVVFHTSIGSMGTW